MKTDPDVVPDSICSSQCKEINGLISAGQHLFLCLKIILLYNIYFISDSVCLGPPETQEHLQECHGAGFERRGLELEREVDLITFWRRISVKLQGLGLST